jgi:flagellar motor switch protein FliN
MSDVKGILTLEVPLIVLLGERQMKVADVVGMATGSIIELPKTAEEELTVLVNNKPVGSGVAVKVGENFGIKVTYIGDIKSRILALGGGGRQEDKENASSTAGIGGIGEAMLAGR